VVDFPYNATRPAMPCFNEKKLLLETQHHIVGCEPTTNPLETTSKIKHERPHQDREIPCGWDSKDSWAMIHELIPREKTHTTPEAKKAFDSEWE